MISRGDSFNLDSAWIPAGAGILATEFYSIIEKKYTPKHTTMSQQGFEAAPTPAWRQRQLKRGISKREPPNAKTHHENSCQNLQRGLQGVGGGLYDTLFMNVCGRLGPRLLCVDQSYVARLVGK